MTSTWDSDGYVNRSESKRADKKRRKHMLSSSRDEDEDTSLQTENNASLMSKIQFRHFWQKYMMSKTDSRDTNTHAMKRKHVYENVTPSKKRMDARGAIAQRPPLALRINNTANFKPDRNEDPGKSIGLDKEHSKEATDKENAPARTYFPSYIKSKLLPHLESLSSEFDDTYALIQQWRFYRYEDLRYPIEQCHCGYIGIRHKYYIQNLNTGKITFVGSRCIGLFNFDKNVIKIAEMLGKIESRGIRGLFIATHGTSADGEGCYKQTDGSDTKVTFQINASLAIVKEICIFGDRSVPIEVPPTVKRPTFTATIKRSLLRDFEHNKRYTIWVKFTQSSQRLTAKITNMKPIPPKNNKNNENEHENENENSNNSSSSSNKPKAKSTGHSNEAL